MALHVTPRRVFIALGLLTSFSMAARAVAFLVLDGQLEDSSAFRWIFASTGFLWPAWLLSGLVLGVTELVRPADRRPG